MSQHSLGLQRIGTRLCILWVSSVDWQLLWVSGEGQQSQSSFLFSSLGSLTLVLLLCSFELTALVNRFCKQAPFYMEHCGG